MIIFFTMIRSRSASITLQLLGLLRGFDGIFQRHHVARLAGRFSTTMSVSLRLPTSMGRITKSWPFCT